MEKIYRATFGAPLPIWCYLLINMCAAATAIHLFYLLLRCLDGHGHERRTSDADGKEQMQFDVLKKTNTNAKHSLARLLTHSHHLLLLRNVAKCVRWCENGKKKNKYVPHWHTCTSTPCDILYVSFRVCARARARAMCCLMNAAAPNARKCVCAGR